MTSIGVHEAKTQFSRLLKRVMAGEEIVIVRGSVPVARLVPVEPVRERELGFDAGLFEIPDDFDELPEDVLADFES